MIGEYQVEEDIKQENAEELGHIINQITLSETDRLLLSEFLKRVDKESASAYNLKLTKFKEHLETIPNSGEFIKALKKVPSRYDSKWERHYPIELTPKSHFIHAEYVRIPPKSMTSFKSADPFNGKSMPIIFYRAVSVLGHIDNKVGGLTKIYYIIKPFGYDFPDRIETNGMTFELIDLYNPQYVCLSEGLPKPIMIDGKPEKPMSNAEYTLQYRKYLKNNVK